MAILLFWKEWYTAIDKIAMTISIQRGASPGLVSVSNPRASATGVSRLYLDSSVRSLTTSVLAYQPEFCDGEFIEREVLVLVFGR